MTEPLVWVPMASGTMPAATAAAEPEDEPPGVSTPAAAEVNGQKARRMWISNSDW